VGPPVALAGGVAGGAPDPGDSSGDDGEDGELYPRRYPNRWKSWQRKKIKKDLEMVGFVNAVRAVVKKHKKQDDEPTSTGKSPDPQSFDGNPEELERFLRQLSNKFALERRHYKQDNDKIRYASLLLKGNAAKWYEAYYLHIDSSAANYIRGRHEPLDASFATWDVFVASLRSSFGSRFTREKAVREFNKLEHSKGIDAFLDELTRLLWQTGYSDDVVKNKISGSLNEELFKHWSKVLDKPDSLAGWLIRLREMHQQKIRPSISHFPSGRQKCVLNKQKLVCRGLFPSGSPFFLLMWGTIIRDGKSNMGILRAFQSPPRHLGVRMVRVPRVMVETRKVPGARQKARKEMEDGRISR
jgi:hypothetical protein